MGVSGMPMACVTTPYFKDPLRDCLLNNQKSQANILRIHYVTAYLATRTVKLTNMATGVGHSAALVIQFMVQAFVVVTKS